MYLTGNIVYHHINLTKHILPSLVVKSRRINELISPEVCKNNFTFLFSSRTANKTHKRHSDKRGLRSLVLTASQLNTFHLLRSTSVMAVSTITSIKKAIGYKVSTKKDSEKRMPKDDSLAPVPTVGFRVGYKMGTTKLQVWVLGARHLPAKVGITPVSGYTVKVCTSSKELQASVALSQAKDTLPPAPWNLLDRRS